MLTIYSATGHQMINAGDQLPAEAVWIDLRNPTPAEEQLVEQTLGFGVPTADDMAEIETSSRLYIDNGAIVMTATLATGLITETPETVPVSFVLGRHHLVTVRYAEIRSFDRYAAQLQRMPGQCASPGMALMGLIDAIVDRLADGLEHVGREVDQISRAAFRRAEAGARGRQQRRSNLALQALLTRLGAAQDGLSKARESVVSLTRALSFLQFAAPKDAGLAAQIKTQVRDLASLADQASFIGSNLTFLLDATLGLISIEQTAVQKIFSVASIVFLPPTLVAGVYGMNFDHMPELGWMLGYPMALGIMLAVAVLPYAIFRWRGWL
ncbi:magnesium transporter CorA family protein [Sandarakinorhabdus sp. AAP62]|uniref:magnesium transporter CorA family protein n=1 Tax=Sandarakinorhabdus sp. AAP62 TaxID=1248916 RepID=UPI0002D5EC18|nr:magnesium transporter CorA family protein [Sandarakinorhabdus sp. AAP62]